MALTNALLKSMGIEGDQRDQIMAAHQETLQSIKDERDGLRDTAARVPILEKEIEDMRAAQPTEDWQRKYGELQAEYESYKSQVATERTEQEKARLYRSMLREAGVDERRIDSIMKVTDLSGISVAEGAIEDADSVREAIAREWGDFMVKTSTRGARVDDPPTNSGARMTRDEIMAIKDTSARQRAIAENIEQFR